MDRLLDFPRGTALVVRTDGICVPLPGVPSIARLQELIGAEMLDVVFVGKFVPNDVMMYVDDNGWQVDEVVRDGVTHLVPTKALKPINAEATRLYHAICRPGTTQEIAGDVVLVHDEDFA